MVYPQSLMYVHIIIIRAYANMACLIAYTITVGLESITHLNPYHSLSLSLLLSIRAFILLAVVCNQKSRVILNIFSLTPFFQKHAKHFKGS